MGIGVDLVLVRRSELSDMNDVNRLLKDLYLYHVNFLKVDLGGYKHIDYDKVMYKCVLTSKEFADFIIEESDYVIGYIRYRFYKNGRVHINELIIDRNFRGIGVGTKLVKESIKRLNGIKTVTLTVQAKNKRAIRVYRSLGFKEVVYGNKIITMEYNKEIDKI